MLTCADLLYVINEMTDLDYLDISDQIGTVKLYIDITYATDDALGSIVGTNIDTGEEICSMETDRKNPISMFY